jgi:putative FmdB family regulatory protein
MFLGYSFGRRRNVTMPIYEYECSECGEAFEELILSISAEKEIYCPTCESKSVKKKISLFGTKAPSSEGSFSSAACTTTT